MKDFLNRLQIKSILVGTGLSFLILCVMAYLNDIVNVQNSKTNGSTVNFNVQKIEKKKTAKIKKPKKRKKKRKSQAQKRARPDLKTALSGSSFGLDLFQVDLGLGDSLGKDLQDMVMTEDSVDKKPVASQRGVGLEYPAEAKARGIQGYVNLKVLIDRRGRVEKVRVQESSPSGVFDQIAMDAIRSWVFSPAEYQGEPVRVWAKQLIRFELE